MGKVIRATLKLPTYNAIVKLRIGGTVKDAVKAWRLKDTEGDPLHAPKASAAGYCFDCGLNQAVWISNDKDTPFTIPVLAHELFHAVWGILDYVKVRDEEAHAYLLTDLMSQALSKAKVTFRFQG